MKISSNHVFWALQLNNQTRVLLLYWHEMKELNVLQTKEKMYLVRAPTSEIDVPIVKFKFHISNRVRQIEADVTTLQWNVS